MKPVITGNVTLMMATALKKVINIMSVHIKMIHPLSMMKLINALKLTVLLDGEEIMFVMKPVTIFIVISMMVIVLRLKIVLTFMNMVRTINIAILLNVYQVI
jgi:hypothetical protein